MKRVITMAVSAVFLQSCLTLNENAPPELHGAKSALDAAYKKDVDDYLPVTMDKAQRAFDEGLMHYRESEDYRSFNRTEMASAARARAVAKAKEAKRLTDNALALFADLLVWDRNIEAYTMVRSDAAQAATWRQQARDFPPSLSEISDDLVIIKPVAYFQTDSADLTKSILDDAGRLIFLLKKHKELYIELRGYADYRGRELYNKQLAMLRAQAVAQLLRQNDISAGRIKLSAFGENIAVNGGNDPVRLQLDRRVEAKLTVLSH